MSSELIGIVRVGVALARTEIGTTRERAHAEPRDPCDRLRGEFDSTRMSAVPRAVRRFVTLPWRHSWQSCHGRLSEDRAGAMFGRDAPTVDQDRA